MRKLAFWWLLSLSACGGRVEGGSHDSEGGSVGSSGSSSGGNAPSDRTGSSSTDNPNADTELGDCMLGRRETYSDDLPCPWVAKDRCYEDRDMACNCACPRSRNSACVSGFDDGPQGHVAVSCN